MIRFIVGILVCLVSGCATSGRIVGTQFIDNLYPIEVTFPDRYNVRALSKDAKQRVEAECIRYSDSTANVRPMFVISIQASEQSLDDFVSAMQDNHFYPDYYWNYIKHFEKDIKVKTYPVRLIYFSSECVGSFGDELLTFTAPNKGITAYIKVNSHYISIEYISSEGWYNEREFMKVLESIQVGEFAALAK